MPVSAHDVAAELRRRVPGLGAVQLQKLLYYSQGHHLAAFGRPLFGESISAWDNGPVVGRFWHAEKEGEERAARELDEGGLNTVGYVLSRYGRLSARDLINLSHAEEPWRAADAHRTPGTSAPISIESLRAFFSGSDDDEPAVVPHDLVRRTLAGAAERLSEPAEVDSLDALRRRLDSLAG